MASANPESEGAIGRLSPHAKSWVPEPELCKSECLHENQDKGKMLRCSSCMKYFHNDCMGESSSYKGSWVCIQCRDSPRLIRFLNQEISSLKGVINSFSVMMIEMKLSLHKHNEDLKNISAINVEISKQLSDKENQFKMKCEQFDQLNSEYIKLLAGENTTSNLKLDSKPKTLLLGSSLIRNVTPKNSDMEVKSISGASLSDLTESLNRCESKYDHVIIVGGGNDCSNATSTTATVSAAMTTLATKAKEIASKVTLSSILPRPAKANFHLKSDHVNEAIKKICDNQPEIEFKDNDGTFKLQDSTPNLGYYVSDGVHLTDAGTTSLIKNLGLDSKCSVKQKLWRDPGKVTHHQSYVRSKPSSIADRTGRNVRCWNCNESGHTYHSCRHPAKVVCYSCGVPGHKSNRCPK